MDKEHFKKKYSLLQSDNSEEDELETDIVSIKFDNCQNIQINYSQLCKHSKLIRNKYLISDVRTRLSKDIQKFQQENKIDSNNLISFLQLLQDEDTEMTNDKYFDFYKLSEFFQIKNLSKNLDKYYQENAADIDFIIQLLLNEQNSENSRFRFATQMENVLVSHIDEFIVNENAKKLPISTIYRILQKCKKNQIPNGELFDLIMKSIPNFFVLFTFIDLQKLSDNQFEDLLRSYTNSNNEYEKYFQYLPCNLNFLNELKNKVSQLEAEKLQIQDKLNKSEQNNEKMQLEILDSNQKSDSLQLQINSLKSQYQNKIFEIEKNNEIMQSELIKSNQKNDNLQIQINDLTNENNQLKSQISEYQNQINYFKNECEKLQKQCEKLESLKNEEDKEEDLFDPFAPFSSNNNESNATNDSNNFFPSFQNEFKPSKQTNNSDLYNNIQDPFQEFATNSNNNGNQADLTDPFKNSEQTKNNNYSEPLQDPFALFEIAKNNNVNQASLNDPFITLKQTKNNNYSEPLQDPFPTATEDENNNENFSNYISINSNNTDPFGTPKEDPDDDLFGSVKNHFQITINNAGSQNLLVHNQQNSFPYYGENGNNSNDYDSDQFESLPQTKNSNNSEPLQDPFPTTGDENDNNNFVSLQDPFQTNNSINQFQFNSFNGGKY